jgi:glyoxylase-like metal-dependent hydrolase (beta-lactamase superfamily II)
MTGPSRKRELGRGERVLPGVWRLRLPLPWPGVPHCNAWAVAAGAGVVLFDCGMHLPGSLAHLERALDQCNLRLEHVRLLVCTHAHIDHYGQAAAVVDRSGCELWMHPDHRHVTAMREDPEKALAGRLEVGRQSGVPEEGLQRWLEARQEQPPGIERVVEPARDLVEGVEITTDLGRWITYETPGHAPSHVCLFQPDRRLLISGDHLLGRVSLYFDYGYTDDPAGEFLRSLDVVEGLDARLCLPGHGRTFSDVEAHINANRALVNERLRQVEAALADGALTAFEVVPKVYGGPVTQATGAWWINKTLCYLRHLEVKGRVRRVPGEPDRWTTL